MRCIHDGSGVGRCEILFSSISEDDCMTAADWCLCAWRHINCAIIDQQVVNQQLSHTDKHTRLSNA